jgi:hypothetical protein
MNNHEFENLERQLSGRHLPGPPAELRAAVLADVRTELAESRRDRWLVRAAAVLLTTGVALNAATISRPRGADKVRPGGTAVLRSQPSLADTAAVVAAATDSATGRRFARHLAAMSGRELTRDEAAAIDAASERASRHVPANGSDG